MNSRSNTATIKSAPTQRPRNGERWVGSLGRISNRHSAYLDINGDVRVVRKGKPYRVTPAAKQELPARTTRRSAPKTSTRRK